jgi:hypothetical protein
MFSTVAFWQDEVGQAIPTGLTYGRVVAGRGSGSGLRAAWSNDGITWNTATTPDSRGYVSCDFSPELGLYIMVSDTAAANNIISSTNGVAWTLRSKPNTNSLAQVAWCPGFSRFLAVGNTNVYSSTDGITWTVAFTHSLTGIHCLKPTYAETPTGNYFVGLGSKSSTLANAFTELIYTSNGTSFATYSFQQNGITFRVATDIVYNKGLNRFLLTSRQELGGQILTSTSLTSSWATYSEPVFSNTTRFQSGDNDTNTFIITNGQGSTTAGLKYSTTGLSNSWASASMPAGNKYSFDVIWCPEINTWVTSNYDDTTAYTSGDGITWTSRTGIINMFHFAWGPGVRTTGYKQGAGIT